MPDPNPVIGVLLTLTGARHPLVELTRETLGVRLGWGWRAEVPRAWIRAAAPDPVRRLSIGAHGWRGRWLVNTRGSNLVELTIDPPARGHCLGVPLRVKALHLSLAEPDAFLSDLDLA